MNEEELRKLLAQQRKEVKQANAPKRTGNILKDGLAMIEYKKKEKEKREEIEDKRRFGTLNSFDDPNASLDSREARLGGDGNAREYVNRQKMGEFYEGSNAHREVNNINYDENGNIRKRDMKTMENASFTELFAENAKKSFYENIVGGFGDLAQFTGAVFSSAFDPNVTFGEAMLDGNFISNYIQDYAEKQALNYDINNPEFHTDENGNFTLETFLDPNFWAVNGGQFAPQIAEIIMTMGATGLVKKGIQKGASAVAKNMAKEAAEQMGNRAIKSVAKKTAKDVAQEQAKKSFLSKMLGQARTSTQGLYEGSKKVNKVGKGSGLLGKIITDRGTLTNSFDNISTAVIGGTLNNLNVSIKNAADLYNTYKDVYHMDQEGNVMVDAEGNPMKMFSSEELGVAASNAFKTNMQYLGLDILSWGLTFGNGYNLLGGAGKKMAGALPGFAQGSGNALTKNIAQGFSNNVSPILKKLANSGAVKLGGKIASEGFEESIQESFEEWSKMKAYFEMRGSLDGYEGAKPGQKMKSFSDFYLSDDSNNIRYISAAMGGLAGGMFNIKTLLNNQADQAHSMKDRAYYLNNQFEANSQDKANQIAELFHQMTELVVEEKGHAFKPLLDDMLQNGNITQEEYDSNVQLYNQIVSQNDAISKMNIRGKKAYMHNNAHAMNFEFKLDQYYDDFQEAVRSEKSLLENRMRDVEYDTSLTDYEKQMKIAEIEADYQRNINNHTKNFQTRSTEVSKMLMFARNNMESLLAGKSAQPYTHEIDYNYDIETGIEVPVVVKKKNPAKDTELEGNTETNAEANLDGSIEQDDNIDFDQSVGSRLKQEVDAFADNNPIVKKAKSFVGRLVDSVLNRNQDDPGVVNQEQDANQQTSDIEEEVKGSIDDLKQSIRAGKASDFGFGKRDATAVTESEDGEIQFDYEVEGDYSLDYEVSPADKFGNFGVLEVDEMTGRKKPLVEHSYGKEEDAQKAVDDLKKKGNKKKFKKKGRARTEGNKVVDNETGKTLKEFPAKDSKGGQSSDNTATKNDKESNNTNDKKQSEKEVKKEEKSEYPRVKNNILQEGPEPKAEALSKKDKDRYNKEGVVRANNLVNIIEKLSNGKKLTKFEEKIYNDPKFKDTIDMAVDDAIADLQDALDTSTLSPEERALYNKIIRNRKGKSIDDVESIGDMINNTIHLGDEDAFGRYRKLDSFNSMKDAVSGKLKGKASTARGFFNKLKNKIFNGTTEDLAFDIDYRNTAESIVVSRVMKKTFPNMNVDVYNVKGMFEQLGHDGLGYTVAGLIFVDDNVWADKKNHFHETSHIYFALTKDEVATQKLLKYGLRNKALVERILKDYDDYIQYKTKDGTIRTKGFFMKNYVLPYMSVSESNSNPEEVFQTLVNDGVIELLPIAEQEVIVDEVFAATLEGPLSDKYSQYWEDKTKDIEERQSKEKVRKGFISRWTSMLKGKGEQSFETDAEREGFFNTLSEDEQVEYSDTLNYIMDRMAEGGIYGQDLSMAARHRLMEGKETEMSVTQKKIADELNKEYEKYREGLTLSQVYNSITDENAEEYADKVDLGALFEGDRTTYANKINDMIRGFSHFWNKAVITKNKNNAHKQGYRELPFLKPERLRYHLNKLVKESENSIDFIHNLRVSEYNEIKYFNEYIKSKNKDDANLIFNSFYFAQKNSNNMSGIQVYVGEDGSVKTNTSLSQSEMNNVDRKMTNIIDDFSVKKNHGRTYRPIQSGWNISVYKSMQNIFNSKNGEYNENDLFNVFRYFAPNNVDLHALWDANTIEINGEVMPLKQAIKSIVKSKENGIFSGINSFNNKPDFNVRKGDKEVPYVRHLVTGIVNENRKFTANQGVLDADMKQHSSVIVNNKALNEVKRMTDDVNSGMSKTAFIKKYSAINESGKGAKSNLLLDMWYDRIKRNGSLDMFRFAGVRNDNTKKEGSLSDNSKESMALNNFFVYLQSFNGEKQMSSYLMDMGRFSDSSTGFMVRVPVHDWSKNLKGDKLSKSNISSLLQNVYNTNNNLGDYRDINDFIDSVNYSIQEDIKFIENQLATKEVKHSRLNEKIFDPKKGKLTEEGRNFIAKYTLSNIVNKTHLGEVFTSTLKFSKKRTNEVTGDVVYENELAKRMKSMLSPMMNFGDHIKMEIMYINDINDDGYTTTDGGGYILEEDADRIRMAGGPMMNLGHTYKVLHAGIERTNPELMNQDIYNKGNLTVLNDDVVAKNPQLKGVYEFMKARRQKYIDNHGEISNNLLDGTPNYMGIVYPHSANKTLKYPEYFRPQKQDGKSEADNVPFISFDNISQNMEAAHSAFDKMYYGENGFVGMEGSGFGVQMVIDGKKKKIKMPVQLLKSLGTDMMVNGNPDEIQAIYDDINKLSQEALDGIYDLAMNGSDAELRDFLKENIDEEFADKNQYHLLFREKFNMKVPYVREFIKNTLSNAVKKKGLKLETPGDIMVEKPSTYRKVFKQKDGSYKSVKTSADLNAQRGNDSLNFNQKDADGNIQPGEIVVSDSFLNEDRRGLRKREYLTTDNPNVNSLHSLEQKAKAIAKKHGVGIGKVFDDNDNHIGYYVQGDTIMATRIPSHGVQSTGFFEIVDTTGEKGNTIQAPNRFKKIIGSDNDGDKLFVQHKGRGTKQWNKIFDKIKNRFLDPNFQWQLTQEIEFENIAKNAVAEVQKHYGKSAINNKIHPFSINGEMKVFDDTIGSKNNIGATMAMHSGMRLLASYGVEFKTPITIDGETSTSFKDIEGKSTSINSAIISNIILDNSKWAFASQLGINDNTIHIASALTNMGFDLDKISVILNHPFAKKYAESRSVSKDIYGKKGKDVFADYRTFFKEDKNPGITIDLNKKGYKLDYNIAKLFHNMDMLMSDFSKLQAVLSSHNNMEVSIFGMEKNLDNINAVLNNVDNKFLKVNDAFRDSPLVRNYIQTVDKNREIQSKVESVANNTNLKDGVVELSNILGNKKAVNAQIENAYNVFYTAHTLGLNNVSRDHYDSLTKKGHPNNIFDRIQEHINTLMDSKSADGMLNNFENNLLFSKAILFNGKGNNQYLSLNNNFMQTSVDDFSRQQIINEFKALPDDLKRDLMLYDLMENGWQGPKSLFAVFDNNIKQDISDAFDIEQNIGKRESDMMQQRFLSNNPHLLKTSKELFIRENGELKFNPKNKDLKNIAKSIVTGNDIVFKTAFPGDVDAKGKPNLRIVRFGSNDANVVEAIKEGVKVQDLVDVLNNNIRNLNAKQFAINEGKGNLPYITIADNHHNDGGGKTDLKEHQQELMTEYEKMVADINNNIKFTSENTSVRERRNKPGKDYYSYAGKLSKDDYDVAMDFNENISEETKNASYQNYLTEREKADNLRSILTDEAISKMSDEDLHKLYGFEGDLKDAFGGKYGNGQGIGWRNKLAYAGVLRPIVLEIAKREATEQGKLLKQAREKYGVKAREDKDIGFWDKWLLANDIPSSHPAVQRVVRRLETEHKKFTKERAKRISKINSATDKIFQEKFGYRPLEGGWKDKIKHLLKLIFADKEAFYRELYGPLIVEEVITDDNGKQVKNMRYKDENEIEAGLKNGTISEGQYEFYKATREISQELIKFSGAKERRGYIPHTAPGMLEALSRRGLLGALTSIGDTNDQINDVMINAKNPLTGKEEMVKYSQVKDWYMALSKSKANLGSSADFIKYKKKAIQLMRKGVNEDGTPIQYSSQKIGSAMGDVFMDRFSNARNIAITEFPSLDLNKAFTDYVDSTLFVHGNENYAGVKKLFPFVDAIMAEADRKGHKNMYDLIDKNWKQYFVQRRKQDTLPTPALIEALGGSTDKAIKFITQGSVVYWLGIKGLLIGGGAYAIGNILAGKYKNILNAGGENFLKGEKRFWLGKSGKFNITDPLRGVKEANQILKNAGFMDINIYDEISISKKSGLEQTMMGMALFPMSYSEKWIQGSHFLGLLTDEEWDTLRDGGKLSDERMVQLEDEVNKSHGKGYQPTNQRMIQMYSWGNMMMQFSKFIPTSIYDKFAPEDIDRFGNYTMGAYRNVGKVIQKAIDGRWSPKDFVEYRRKLTDQERQRLDAGLMGMGFGSLLAAIGVSTDSKWMTDIVSDDNIFADVSRMKYKATHIPAATMLGKIF